MSKQPDGSDATATTTTTTTTHLEVVDEEAPGRVVDHRVQGVRVQGQRVVVVEAVDVHLGQAHLVVGVDGGGVEEVARTGGDQVCSGEKRCKHRCNNDEAKQQGEQDVQFKGK